ncbi:FABP domain-containing protein [Aphelenchoides bicaudatus]|nr:FABP domain-containing protein [Aphelenchoides bicaudatus]
MSLDVIPEKFFGRYKLERSENFDEFLASKGLGWIARKFIGAASITKVIEKSDEKPNCYNFTNLTTKTTTNYKNFVLGKEFEDKGLDGENHKILFQMTDPNILSERHVRLNIPGDKGEFYHYTIEGEYLVLTMANEQVQCKRWMKRI